MTRFLLVSLAVLSLSSPLHAQDGPSPEQQAREHFAEGQRLVAAGRFEDALEAFRQGYALSHRPLFLFNMAESARQAEHPGRALALYEQYLGDAPEGSAAETARARVQELRAAGVVPELESAPASEAGAAEVDAPAPSLEVQGPPLAGGGPAIELHTEIPPAERHLEVWEDWPFWTIVGAVVVAGATATVVGVAVTSGPTCGAGCIDFRSPL